MRVVIADASCLILLTNLNEIALLASVYREVWITNAVSDEYRLPLPDFISLQNPTNLDRVQSLQHSLDPGEATAIALAVENPGCQIIIDEKKGRRVASDLGLDVTGTLGVLNEAGKRGLIKINELLIKRLELAGFRMSAELKRQFLADR